MAFRPAVRDETKLLIGLVGPSSSGKTWSALDLGSGMVEHPASELALIDTENGRGKHYADDFNYMYDQLTAPYTPMAYMAKIKEAVGVGAKCVIVDSTSHVHAGVGGILDWHEREITRMVGDRDTPQRREAMNFAAWAKPKAAWSAFANEITQLDVHLIFCFRAKEKLKMVKVRKGDREVNEPTPMGWQPIITEDFNYELTTMLMLPPLSEGRYDVNAEASKIIGAHRDIFVPGGQINREMGRQMVAWAKGSSAGRPTLLQRGEEAATRGTEALRIWFAGLSRDQQRAMEADKDRLKVEAQRVDQAKGNAAQTQQDSMLPTDPSPAPGYLVPEGPTNTRVMALADKYNAARSAAEVTEITKANADWTSELPENMLSILDTARSDAGARLNR